MNHCFRRVISAPVKTGTLSTYIPKKFTSRALKDALDFDQFIKDQEMHVISFDWLNFLQIGFSTSPDVYSYVKSAFPELTDEFEDINGLALQLWMGSFPYYFIFVNDVTRRVIVHECTHMVHTICESKGIPLSNDNTETIAYMTDYLVEQVYQCLFDQGDLGGDVCPAL